MLSIGNSISNRSPSTRVGHDSSRDVRPFKNIWCKKRTVSQFKKIELTSSCEHGGRFELAAILKGRKKQETSTSSCSMYSSSASTMLKTRLLRLRMLSAWGDLMYSSTICFQRRRHNQPRKKLWTFLILRSSTVSCTWSDSPEIWEVSSPIIEAPLKLPRPTGVADIDGRAEYSRRSEQIFKRFFKEVFRKIFRTGSNYGLKYNYTSARSFLISDASSSHCWVYCHLAVFSLSTTCRRWTCFCSSSSFCNSSLLKL